MRKLIPLISLLFIFVFQATAQKTVTFEELKSRINTFKDYKDYVAGFSKSADQSLVSCQLSDIYHKGTLFSSNTWIPLHVGFNFQGVGFNKTVDNFKIYIYNLGRSWVFIKNEHLLVIADGQTIDTGTNEENNEFKKNFLNADNIKPSLVTALVFPINRTTLEKISAAKNVEIKVGDGKDLFYKIKPEELEPVRKLLLLSKVEE